MNKNVFKKVLAKAEKIEQEFGSLENFVINTTIGHSKHRMRMEEEYSSNLHQLEKVYQGLNDLELADLVDYQNLIGRFDGEFS